MSLFNCNCKCNCTVVAIIASAIIGVLTAFFQITGVIAVGPIFFWVVFGLSVVYLGVLVITAALTRRNEETCCICSTLNAVLAGILGAILFSAVLLAVGITATSVIAAILVGLLLFFTALVLTSSACLVRYLLGCGD